MGFIMARSGSRQVGTFVLAAILVAGGILFGGLSACPASSRPDSWARPVASTVLPNWYKVDDGLYRSRQPDRNGFEEIRRRGIRTIVDLRAGHSDARLVEGLGFNLVAVPLRAWHFTDDQILSALKAIQAGPKPVLVHCQQGADRTGAVIAAYRVIVQGWSKDEAIAELKKGGFGFHWYYLNIPAFLRRMDVAKFRSSPPSGSEPLAGRQGGDCRERSISD
jgi:tyrosine-protein phosphatase SIW14